MDVMDFTDKELIKELEDRGYIVAYKKTQHVIIRQRSEGKTLALYNHYNKKEIVKKD